MAGLLNSFKTMGSGLLALPGQIVQGYGSAYAALPQRFADAEAERARKAQEDQMALDNARRTEELIKRQYATDPAGELAQRTNAGFTSASEERVRAPYTLAPGQGNFIGNVLRKAMSEGGINGRTPWVRDPITGTYSFQQPRSLDAVEQTDIDATNRELELRGQQIGETIRSNKAQEGLQSRALSLRASSGGGGDSPTTMSKVQALIASKVANGIPLTAGEEEIYRSNVLRGGGGGPFGGFGGAGGFGYGGAPAAAPATGGGLGDPLGIRK